MGEVTESDAEARSVEGGNQRMVDLRTFAEFYYLHGHDDQEINEIVDGVRISRDDGIASVTVELPMKTILHGGDVTVRVGKGEIVLKTGSVERFLEENFEFSVEA